MGIKVTREEIAWIEEFGTLDQPIHASGSMIITLRSLLWIGIGAILIYKGITLGGTKIANVVPVMGLPIIIPGALFVLFGIVPSKSVRREVQFLFAINLIIKRLTGGGSKNTKNKPKTKKVKVTRTSNIKTRIETKENKRARIEKKKIVEEKKKKKVKPVKISLK